MKILVTGGAGYIGSHTVRYLIEKGHDVVVYDNLSTGHRRAVDPRALLIEADIMNQTHLVSAIKNNQIEGILHFAGSIEVAESISNPGKYFLNNTFGTLQVLQAMQAAGVKKIVYSSTAAVYGMPKEIPILETSACAPINPYGQSKFFSEMMIQDFHKAHGISYTILRYFNVAGSWPDGSIGEDHKPESHLIPRILKGILQNHPIQIFGNDYPTLDGTCVRDYIHVVDLAAAHLLAMENLTHGTAEIMNVGSQAGYSVKEVISACEKIIGKNLKVITGERRHGDPATLVASSEKIKKVLGWERKFSNLEDMIQHAYLWHTKNPKGYLD